MCEHACVCVYVFLKGSCVSTELLQAGVVCDCVCVCYRSSGWSRLLLLSSGSSLANGLRLITSSSLSPASVMSGTARQQSKSLVLTWFTWMEAETKTEQPHPLYSDTDRDIHFLIISHFSRVDMDHIKH